MGDLEKTKNYYDGIATGYKDLYHEEQILKINVVKKNLPNSGIVLDCGSGDGVLNQFLNLDKIELYSIDLSEKLLELNSNINARKIVGNIESMSFENEMFDACISFSVLQDINSPLKALNEIYRVLKNNGLAIISFVKFSSKKDLLINLIREKFVVLDYFEEEKDLFFILKKST